MSPLDQEDIAKIKETASDFFERMAGQSVSMNARANSEQQEEDGQARDSVDLEITLSEPQIFIGQQGQTLFEIQRLLRTMLNKKLAKVFYLNLDINGYKQKKIEYLQDLANDSADYVASTGRQKVFSPMSAYERRIVHSVLSKRQDIVASSHGEGPDRHIVIIPR